MEIIADVAASSDEALLECLDRFVQQMTVAQGGVVVCLGEVARRQLFRADGATSTEAWVAERAGLSTSTARRLTHLGEKAWDIPRLIGALCTGALSLDRVHAVAKMATPETDQALCDQARTHTVTELADLARRTTPTSSRSAHERRYLRFNEPCRTMTVQLAPEYFAEARACLEARAKTVPTDGATPWDQRCCDAFMELIRSSGDPATRYG